MQSEKTGKTISKIKFNKKNIVITFEEGDKISISEEAFSTLYLYVGKTISYQNIKNLQDITNSSKNLKYAMGLLQKGHYSEFKMREKLYAKEASKKEVDGIIKILKRYGLIDDSALAYDLKEYGNEKLYGKNKIIKNLYDKGIFQKEIEKLTFPKSEERRKALELMGALERRYEKYPYYKKKANIYNALIANGFDPDIVNDVMGNVKRDDEIMEWQKLRRDYSNLKSRYSKKYEGRELKEKLISSLARCGYSMNKILKIVGGQDNDQNDF